MLAWKEQDPVSKALTIVTAGYFLFFFFQSHTAFHHFIPIFVLPVAVFWRTLQSTSNVHSRKFGFLTAVAFTTAFLFSIPSDVRPDDSGRIVGRSIEDRTGGYAESESRAFGRAAILQQLFPGVWDARVPNRSYGGSWMTWYFYAQRSEQTAESKNYVLQYSFDVPPDGAKLVAKNADAALYVRDLSVWRQHREMRP
jgi:hypothetical protein